MSIRLFSQVRDISLSLCVRTFLEGWIMGSFSTFWNSLFQWNIWFNLNRNFARGKWIGSDCLGSREWIKLQPTILYFKFQPRQSPVLALLQEFILFWSNGGNFIENTWQNWNWLEYWVPIKESWEWHKQLLINYSIV